MATTACTKPRYDKLADRTSAEWTLGGQATVTVILAGNGRRQDDRAILIGESATTVELTGGHAVMDCLYTVQVLRRGVSELQFSLPVGYTVTNVACPNLVRWSVRAAGKVKHLVVQLRATGPGQRALHVKATGTALGAAAKWRAPQMRLIGAAFQRGYLLVDPGKDPRAAVIAAKPKFVLIVGDVKQVPAHVFPATIIKKWERDPNVANDNHTADIDGDHVPDVAIGRIPADTPDEAKLMLGKVIAYETSKDFGRWRRRINVVAGVGGFGVGRELL